MELDILLICSFVSFLDSNFPEELKNTYQPDFLYSNTRKKLTRYYFLEISLKVNNVYHHLSKRSDIICSNNPRIRQQITYIHKNELQLKQNTKSCLQCNDFKNDFYLLCKSIAEENNVKKLKFYHNNNPACALLIKWLSLKFDDLVISNNIMSLNYNTDIIRNNYKDTWFNVAERCCTIHRKDAKTCSFYTLQAIAHHLNSKSDFELRTDNWESEEEWDDEESESTITEKFLKNESLRESTSNLSLDSSCDKLKNIIINSPITIKLEYEF